MARLAIFTNDREKWVPFDEDTEVLIRFIGKEELTAINRKAEKAAKLAGGDSSEIFNRFLAEKSVLGWRNVSDHNDPGIEIPDPNNDRVWIKWPFTPENRNYLMKKSIPFSTFVNATCTNDKTFIEDDEVPGDDQKND